jgi:excisionase family DNA binding protein
MRKKDVLTTGQVAQLCNVAPRTVTKWFDSGQLGGYRIPGSKDRRIPQNELIRFMKAHDIPTGDLEKGKLRILIIDSRTEYAQRFANQLRTQGSFEVQCAHNSFDAGLTALKFSPNIILFDLMSSDIDSGSLCGYVRECEDLADCTLIALAGGLGPKETAALRNRGFDAVVTEPDNMNAILSCIQQGCDIFH